MLSFKKRGQDVIEILQLKLRDFLADETLDGAEIFEFLNGHEREGIAHFLGATGAANTMDVILGMLRHVVVDHVRDTLDIKPARGDIRRHHHLVLAGLESFERFDAFALRAVRMQRRYRM